jgi:hypothetical protein
MVSRGGEEKIEGGERRGEWRVEGRTREKKDRKISDSRREDKVLEDKLRLS